MVERRVKFGLLQSKARVMVSDNPPAPKFLYSHPGEKASAANQLLHMQVTQCLRKPTHFSCVSCFLLFLLLACAFSNLGSNHTSNLKRSRTGSLVLRQAIIVWLCLLNTLTHAGGFVPRIFWEGSLALAGLLTMLENYLEEHQLAQGKTVPGTI